MKFIMAFFLLVNLGWSSQNYNEKPERLRTHFAQDIAPIYEEPSSDEMIETISSVFTIPEDFDAKKFAHNVFSQFTKKILDKESAKVIFGRAWCKETGEALSEPQLQRLTDTFFQLLDSKGLIYYKSDSISDSENFQKDSKGKAYVQIASPKNKKIKRASSGDLRECIEQSLALAAEEENEEEDSE